LHKVHCVAYDRCLVHLWESCTWLLARCDMRAGLQCWTRRRRRRRCQWSFLACLLVQSAYLADLGNQSS
jgi:hypothetical protein